ncbi:MAG: hypothetical protein GY701_28110, partial [Sulfitobacter sp.]|nr:hypothetical protein [Sulfitobacter sp.]
YLGFATITTDGSGDATFTATIEALVYADEEITATATVDNGDGTYGDTSEFAANFTATAATNDAPTFMPLSADGRLTTPIGLGDDRGRGVTVQADGKILVAGYSHNGASYDFALTRYNADGTLDTSFGGGDGILTTAIASGNDYAQTVAVQSDGNILVAGYSWNGTDYQFAVTRYDTHGTIDTSFGVNGVVTKDLSTDDDKAFGLAIQSDGKILVTGDEGDHNEFAVVRYNTDGSLDASFGSGGVARVLIPDGSPRGYGVVVQTDGKILLSGRAGSGGYAEFALVRLNTDGSIDTGFGGGDGIVSTSIGGGHDMGYGLAVHTDGTIVVAGYLNATNDFAAVRYNSDGSLDTTFDIDGKVVTDMGVSTVLAQSVAIQADGKVILAGRCDSGIDTDFSMVRYNTDGSLDTSFDFDGRVITDFGNGADDARGIVIQSDGKILLVGQASNGTDDDIALARYNADGSLDTTFDSVSTLDGN